MQKKSLLLKIGTIVREPKSDLRLYDGCVYLIIDVTNVDYLDTDCLSFTMMSTTGSLILDYIIPIDWIDKLNFFEILS